MKKTLKKIALVALVLALVSPAFASAEEAQTPAGIAGNTLDSVSVDSLFGRNGVSSSDISAFTKWANALQREQNIQATEKVRAWVAFLDSIRDLSRAEQLAAVNAYVNQFPYVTDMDNYGVADYWATAEEFFERGGDCEDFSLVKYFSLVALGFSSSDMRLVILYDNGHRLDHAVLAVTMNGEVDILDNQFSSVREASTIATYKPIYAISQERWWRFI